MKVNIEIPDDLYRKVEAKGALEGRSLDEVCEDLFRRYANEDAREDHQEGVGLPTELGGKPLPP